MSHPAVLAVGAFSRKEAAALSEAFAAPELPELADALDLPEAERAAVKAIALKKHTAFDGEVMDAFPALALISNYGVGYDAIDIDAARARGIAVTNTPDVLNDDVADLAVAMLLAQRRRLVEADAFTRAGKWGTEHFPLTDSLTGARVGILGLGRIGREIADRLAAFKTELHYWSRSEKDVPGWPYHDSPVALARAVDILAIAVVGGAETENIVSAEVIDALGPTGVIVNISRGSTVDEAAMIAALEEGRLAGAGLDVFRNEPEADPRLLAMPNVVVQPHLASATPASRDAMAILQRENIAAFLEGSPLKTPVT